MVKKSVSKYLFADRFGQRRLIDKYLDQASGGEEGPFSL